VIISVSIQLFLLSFKDATFIRWRDCNVLKLKEKRQKALEGLEVGINE
jgi:hypothetical protein